MIIGIGHDITDITRIKAMLTKRSRDAFISRILTGYERDYLDKLSSEARKAEFIAGRFAVKEAVSKAFGCGIGEKLSFQDITVERLPDGRPRCRISGQALEKLGYAKEKLNIHISISHERQYASAYVVIEQ